MRSQISIFLWAFLGLFSMFSREACSAAAAAAELRVSVLSYNVENLFDTKHDDGKQDLTYLPLSEKKSPAHAELCRTRNRAKKWRDECLNLDWSEKALTEKLERIAQVLRSAGKGQGADIVVLQEVENIGVLERLNRDHLKGLGYSAFLVEGVDERGIDTAVLSRWPLRPGTAPELHAVDLGRKARRKKATPQGRGFLELRFRSPTRGGAAEDPRDELHVWALHLPSPRSPVKSRKLALAELDRLARPQAARGALVVAAGDFNISAREERKQRLIEAHLKNWRVSHRDACASCVGTAYFGAWSFLDQIWMARDSEKVGGWRMDPESVRVLSTLDFQKDKRGRPLAFAAGGVSDHLPIYAEFVRALP